MQYLYTLLAIYVYIYKNVIHRISSSTQMGYGIFSSVFTYIGRKTLKSHKYSEVLRQRLYILCMCIYTERGKERKIRRI